MTVKQFSDTYIVPAENRRTAAFCSVWSYLWQINIIEQLNCAEKGFNGIVFAYAPKTETTKLYNYIFRQLKAEAKSKKKYKEAVDKLMGYIGEENYTNEPLERAEILPWLKAKVCVELGMM